MNPAAKFHGDLGQSKKEININGARPSPLSIRRDSHFIHKSSSSSISFIAPTKLPETHQQQRKPIIIYIHSPKIIHTQARDFMALVQKLTGKSRSNVNDQSSKKSASNISASINYGSMTINNNIIKQEQDVCDDNDRRTSVVTIEENCRTGGVQGSVNQSNNLFFGELPLFTPNSTDFFSSPRPLNRYLDSPYGIMGSLISPAGLEFMKGLPEY